ncbi:unnamed protein product, partial [Ectocarpus fasciculatus]
GLHELHDGPEHAILVQAHHLCHQRTQASSNTVLLARQCAYRASPGFSNGRDAAAAEPHTSTNAPCSNTPVGPGTRSSVVRFQPHSVWEGTAQN